MRALICLNHVCPMFKVTKAFVLRILDFALRKYTLVINYVLRLIR